MCNELAGFGDDLWREKRRCSSTFIHLKPELGVSLHHSVGFDRARILVAVFQIQVNALDSDIQPAFRAWRIELNWHSAASS